MQIAKVVPNIRTKNEGIFDYAIPPELLPSISIGVLVCIPFHGRNIQGIVTDIKRSSKIPNLKPIINIVDSVPVIDKYHIDLAKWMSEYYLEPIGKTFFENIVPVAKRKITNTQNQVITTQANKLKKNQYLVFDDFKYRLEVYKKAIEKTLARGKQVIILLPDLSIVPFFIKNIKRSYSLIHSGLPKTQRYLEWQKIRDGKISIVIGSNSALFAPVRNLGLVIIDQEENETYKSFQSPRFHVVGTGMKLAELSNSTLILGSVSPRIETYYQTKINKLKLLRTYSKSNDRQRKSIVDMNGQKEILSFPLKEDITNTLKNGKKILLVLNRKGEGTKFSCTDCNWIYKCEKCGLPLVPQKTSAVCYNCEKNFKLPASCQKCKSIKLKPFGMGTVRLEKIINNLWPKAKVIRIDKSSNVQNISNFDIAICTNYALKFQFPKIGLVGIIDADQSLNFPEFRASERTFQNLFKFLKIGERGVIQTHLPENAVISALAKMDYDSFFDQEITNRKEFDLPPFSYLTRLLYKNQDEEICKKETEKIAKELRIKNKELRILGPNPCFITKEREKYRYQIIIKSKSPISSQSSDLRSFLRNLPKGWIVDVDPVELI